MKKTVFLSVFVPVAVVAIAQNKNPDYSKMPYWIEMIKNPNVNYFEAVTAYNEFWKGKKKPVDENEMIGQDKQASAKGKETREEKKEKELYRKYALDCKKFEHWQKAVQPYVQADGHILTKEEQLKAWEEQKSKRN